MTTDTTTAPARLRIRPRISTSVHPETLATLNRLSDAMGEPFLGRVLDRVVEYAKKHKEVGTLLASPAHSVTPIVTP